MPDVGVIQQFLHPPIGVLAREVIAGGPFSGYHSFQRVRGPVGVDAFGIGWSLETWPAGYGTFGDPVGVFFDRNVLELRVLHRFFDGSDAWTQRVESDSQVGFVLFNEALPWLVRTQLAPGVTGSYFWLVAL
jgi:hypothetical protein